MRSSRIFLLVSVVLVLAMNGGAAWAESAQVLPKGVSMVDVKLYSYFNIDERYDPDGDAEDIAVDYNTDLNSSVFPDLAVIEGIFSLPPGTGTLGQSVVDFTLVYRWWEISYSYGLTDNLTLGILIPYNYSKNDVDAVLDNSTATLGKFPVPAAYDPLADPPFVPIAGGVPLTTQDIQDLLGPGLDINQDGQITGLEPQGFGYDPVETWSDSGIGDIELLAKYKFHDRDDWRLAFTGGVRLATGEVDDPDNLVDIPFGDGQTDIILRFYSDFLGIEKVALNATLAYEIQLPDEETKRVPNDVNLPLTANKEKVDRDLGDLIDLKLSGVYSLGKDWSIGLQYRYTEKSKDDVDGDLGLNYSSLEEETDFTSHMAILMAHYSTVQRYLDKETRFPFNLGLEYRNRFAGTNNVTKSEYVAANFSIFF